MNKKTPCRSNKRPQRKEFVKQHHDPCLESALDPERLAMPPCGESNYVWFSQIEYPRDHLVFVNSFHPITTAMLLNGLVLLFCLC